MLLDQELRALGGVAGDGAARFGAVGQAGSIADKGVAGGGQPMDEGAENGESAEAGIEDADGGWGHVGILPFSRWAASTETKHNSLKTLAE